MSEIRSQATPARDELAETVFDLLTRVAEVGTSDRNVIAHGIAMGLEDAGWSKPRTVNSATDLDALDPNAVCSFIDSNGITYACTAAEWQMDGFFSTAKPFPTITVHTRARST